MRLFFLLLTPREKCQSSNEQLSESPVFTLCKTLMLTKLLLCTIHKICPFIYQQITKLHHKKLTCGQLTVLVATDGAVTDMLCWEKLENVSHQHHESTTCEALTRQSSLHSYTVHKNVKAAAAFTLSDAQHHYCLTQPVSTFITMDL